MSAFQQEISTVKSFLYFAKKFRVHDTLSRQLNEQNLHLKEYINALVQDIKQEHARDALQVKQIQSAYKTELEQPYNNLNRELEDIKRSYQDLMRVIEQQKRQKAAKEQDLELIVRDVLLDVDKIKTNMGVKDDLLKALSAKVEKISEGELFNSQKFDIIHRQCEENEKTINKMKHELETYIERELSRRRKSWRVDFGEEAKIDLQTRVNSMVKLANNVVAIGAQQNEQENNHVIEIFDASGDFE